MKLIKLLDLFSDCCSSLKDDRMHRAYHSVVQRVIDYCGDYNIRIKRVFAAGFLKNFEQHLRGDGLKDNTISSYMNALRSLYREARQLDLVPFIPELFDHVFTGSAPTEKRALEPDVIALILSADLSDDPSLGVSRDFFILSFLLHGMPFVDLVHLAKTAIQGDLIVYRRKKTGRTIMVPIHPNARLLLDKYASRSTGSYALCLLDPDDSGRVPRYDSLLRRHNRHLEVLSERLGLEKKLTSYVARHSWATIAYHSDVKVPVVSEAMGHSTEKTTRVYLSSFSYEYLREAGRTVFDAVVLQFRESGKRGIGILKKSVQVRTFVMDTGCFAVDSPVRGGRKRGVGVNEKCPSSCT